MKKEMKRSAIILLILLSGIQILHAQDLAGKLASLNDKLISQYSLYFASAELTEAKQLKLNAKTDYIKLSKPGKKAVVDNLIRSWQESLVIIQNETYKELWTWDNDKNESRFIDSWDLVAKVNSISADKVFSPVSKHPWFFYVGNMLRYNSNHDLNGAINLRMGFFLLRNRWDVAASVSEQLSGNVDNDDDLTVSTNVGLSTKVYFPIKNLNMSPYVGGMASISATSGSSTVTPSFLVGASYLLGIGCFDVGMSMGKSTMMMVGYTIIPNYRFSK
jgi:hypothetical protein